MQETHLKNKDMWKIIYLWFSVFIYFAINALTQYWVSKTADLDQTEQLVLSQDFLLGYTSQPPLYTWIVYCVFLITGPTLSALLGIKVILLSLFVAILIGIGCHFSFTIQQHLISLSSLVFIPQYIWQSQRDLTHSVLVTVMAAATLLQAFRTQRNPKLFNYIIFGLSIGMGLMSKYNFVIFLVALLITVELTPKYRKIFNNYRIFISILVAVLLVFPHVFWVFNYMDVATGSVDRLNATGNNHFKGIINALGSAFMFFTPLWIFLFLLKNKLFDPKKFFMSRKIKMALTKRKLRSNFYEIRMKFEKNEIVANLFWITIGLIFIFIIVTGTQEMRDRWYNPLFFFVPLLIALKVNVSQKNVKIYFSIAAIFALIVGLALPARTLLAESINYTSRPNMPYESLAQNLSSNLHSEPISIFSENKLIGGNFRQFFKNSRIITPDHDWVPIRRDENQIVLCETQNCNNSEFRDWMYTKHHINLNLYKFYCLDEKYYYFPKRNLVIYWTKINHENKI